jgi:hypothetical protein
MTKAVGIDLGTTNSVMNRPSNFDLTDYSGFKLPGGGDDVIDADTGRLDRQ